MSIDEDYYKSIITNDAFNNNYIQYETKGDTDKILTPSEYLDMIKPYLSGIINDLKSQGKWRIDSGNKIIERKTQGEWKIQLTMTKNFISSKDSDETRTTIGNETNEIIEELFNFFLQKYPEGLEESTRGSEFIFDSVDALHYDLNKISLSRGGPYIDSPNCLKDKKVTINLKNTYEKCFPYALTVALNYEQVKKNPQRISKIKPFIDQYNWKEIDFPSHSKKWKNSLNQIINQLLLIVCMCLIILKKRHACKLKYNLNRKNQVIL